MPAADTALPLPIIETSYPAAATRLGVNQQSPDAGSCCNTNKAKVGVNA